MSAPPLHVRKQARAAYAFLAPGLILIGVFFAVPVLGALLLSFTDFDLYAIGDPSALRVIGLRNYRELVSDPVFWIAMRNTLFFVVVGAPLSVFTSLGAALLLDARLARWRTLFRTVYFAPVVTTLVAVAIVWRYLLHPRYGLINEGLMRLGLPAVDWLGDPHWSMPAIVLLAVWKNFGYNMVIFLAGLQSIPEELYEAAHLDGAGAWQRFRHVTMPMLGPTFLFVGITTMLGNFQLFSEPYVMTQGGPLRSTTTVMLLMYEQGFRWWRMGYGAAIAFALFLVMLAVTWLQLRVSRESAR
jgi:multiple sugar transport system permease protein